MMIDIFPSISIIIPCRNEKDFIVKCLDSIFANDYPAEKREVLVIDGMSEDGTREVLKKYIASHPSVKMIDNPKKITPSALNLGIKNAKGEVIIRMDAHASYQKDYIKKCLKYLKDYGADNVGGVVKTLPAQNTIVAKAIAASLSGTFGAGSSYFRIGAKEPKWVDTVFGGCYKRNVFDRVGFFNENLVRSQDMEFNLRLKKAGGKILLAPDIISYYYPSATLGKFFSHNIQDGIWAVLPFKFAKRPLRFRHYVPLLFFLTLPLSIWFYLPVSLYFSFKIALEMGDARYFFIMPVVFFARHFAYGLGSLVGLAKLII